jgi:YHS domain-containing protein
VIRVLLITILVLLLARAFWRLVDGIIEVAGGSSPRRRRASPAVKLARDPVCGTFVTPGRAPSLTARGTTHYFCSEQCRTEFQHKERR